MSVFHHAHRPGFADDYACMVAGCLDLYECGGGLEWLQWALKLQATMDRLFADEDKGLVWVLYCCGFASTSLSACILELSSQLLMQVLLCMLMNFVSTPTGGYYGTSGDDPSIKIRIKDDYDGAEPTASSIATSNLFRQAQ